MNNGIYKIYNQIHSMDGIAQRLIGRILVHQGSVHLLEDHGLKGMFPEGPLTEVHEKNFGKCSNSWYFRVEPESDELGLEESLGMCE